MRPSVASRRRFLITIIMENNGDPYRFVEIAGTIIRYRIDGSGKAILILHGWGGSVESFAATRNELRSKYTVITLDLPGHGASGIPPSAWGVADYTRCVSQFIDFLNLQRVHVIGHSFGGRITIYLAATKPQQVNKIILVDSAGIIPPRTLKYNIRVVIGKMGKVVGNHGGRLGQRIRQAIYEKIASADYKAAGPLRDTFVKVIREDLKELMPEIETPTLLMWGETDEDTPISSAKLMEKLIPHAELIILANAGHYSYLDQPTQFHLHIKRFLRN